MTGVFVRRRCSSFWFDYLRTRMKSFFSFGRTLLSCNFHSLRSQHVIIYIADDHTYEKLQGFVGFSPLLGFAGALRNTKYHYRSLVKIITTITRTPISKHACCIFLYVGVRVLTKYHNYDDILAFRIATTKKNKTFCFHQSSTKNHLQMVVIVRKLLEDYYVPIVTLQLEVIQWQRERLVLARLYYQLQFFFRVPPVYILLRHIIILILCINPNPISPFSEKTWCRSFGNFVSEDFNKNSCSRKSKYSLWVRGIRMTTMAHALKMAFKDMKNLWKSWHPTETWASTKLKRFRKANQTSDPTPLQI